MQLFCRHISTPLARQPRSFEPCGRAPIQTIARRQLLPTGVISAHWLLAQAHATDARRSSSIVAAASSGGGGGRGGGRGGRKGARGGGRGRGSGKKAPPPLDLATADVAAAALSIDPALVPLQARDAQQQQGEEEDEEEDGESSGASSSPSSSSSSPRLPDALHAAMPARFPTLSAARRAIRKGSILVAAAGADDGAFDSVAPPTALAERAAAFCAAAGADFPQAPASPHPPTFIVGNCGTRVLGPGVWMVALEPGAEAAKAAAASGRAREAASLGIAYEDDDLAVVVKPWGVLMSGGDPTRTVSAALARMVATDDGETSATTIKFTPSPHPDALPRPQAAHRLDAAVGGLVAVGKTRAALAALSAAFRERRVRKRYRALLRGRLDPEEALARGVAEEFVVVAQEATPPAPSDEEAALDEAFLSPVVGAGALSAENNNNTNSRPRPKILTVRLPLDGKPCETRMAVAGYSRCPRYGGWLTAVDLEPVTGRQHQLRRHCAALGHAIVGDGRYRGVGGGGKGEQEESTGEEERPEDGRHIGGQGLFLESVALAFEWPPPPTAGDANSTPRMLLVEQPEPRRFVTLRAQQRSAWAKAQRIKARAAAEEAEAAAAAAAAAARD